MCKAGRRELGKLIMEQNQQEQQVIVAKQQQQQQNERLSLLEHLGSSDVSTPRSASSSGSSTPISGHTISSSINRNIIKVTLLCRKADDSILYMEAGKDFVDLLMSFMTLPIGTVLKLLRDHTESRPKGGIANIYDSILDMDESLLYVDKEPLVSPKAIQPCDLLKLASSSSWNSALSEQAAPTPKTHIYYKCCNHGCLRFVIDLPGQICPVCKFAMSHKLELIQPKGAYPPPSPPSPPTPMSVSVSHRRKDKAGFVKKNRTFIVTDSLEILPLSTITSVVLLSKLKLESLKDLESVQTTIGVSQILELLKASLSSTTALNDVFRSKMNTIAKEN